MAYKQLTGMHNTIIRGIGTAVALTAIVLHALAGGALTGRGITSKDGLPSNQVNDLVQDETGCVWLATAGGLSRYDGYSFVNFHSTGTGASQTSGSIGTLHIDRKHGLMWIRTATFRYACYDTRQGRFAEYCGGCDPKKTFERFLAEDGGIWMYEAHGGIRHVTYAGGTFSCRDFTAEDHSLPRVRLKRMLADGKGNVWAFTDNGLLKYDGRGAFSVTARGHHFMMGNVWKDKVFFLTDKGRILIYNTEGKLVRETAVPGMMGSTAVVNGNIVWQDKWVIMTREAVITMDCRDYTVEKPQELQMTYGIALDQMNGNFWVSDDNGTLWLFPQKGQFRKFKLLEDKGIQISHKRNFSTIQGTDGKFYIATYGNGLFIYDPANEHLEHYTARDPHPLLATDYLINIHADRDGNVWIGQEDAGIVCLQQGHQPAMLHLKLENDRQGGKLNYITRLTKENDGSVRIVSASNNAYVYTPPTNSISRVGEEKPSSGRLDSITDRYGHMWISTWEQGLQMKHGGRLRVLLDRSIPESRINDMTIDRRGRLWVATFNGLYVTDTRHTDFTNDSFLHFSREEGIPTNEIHCLYAADDGSVWTGGVGTGVIRCMLDKDNSLTIDNVTTRRGLASDNIYALTEDAWGNIWASSEEVLSRITPKTMRVHNYRVSTSLLEGIYSRRCATRLNDGRLMFGTHDGISIITPPAMSAETAVKRRPHVTNIEINGRSVFYDEKYADMRSMEKEISLANDENSLTIHYSCFDYAMSGQAIYQFWLEGYDKAMGEPTTQSSVDYGNLPPGRYVFHLRTADGGEETTLSITIHEPWYNTWWAWTVYLLILGGAAATFYHYKRENMKRKQMAAVEKQVAEFRINFFTQVVHEFRTPLAIISGAVDKMTDDSGTLRKPIQTARRGVKRMTQLVNHLMEFRKVDTENLRLRVERGDIVGFVRDICQDLWTSTQQKEQRFTFQPAEKKHDMVFDRHIIDTIVYNLVSNAVKYTPHKGSIMVRLRFDDDCMVLTVEDSGPGIDAEREKQLFQPFMHGYASQGGMGIGLYTSRRMAQTHKGSLAYGRSETLGGAMFTLTLPASDSVYEPEDYNQITAIENTESKRNVQAEQIIREMLPQALNNLHIAIIEDDPDMLEQTRTEMAVYFQIEAYSTGQEGYEGVLKNKPSLLICDVMLPDMNGYDIVKKMKAEPSLRDVPVIMLTALDDEHHQIKGYESGADDYMVKPCNYRILTARAIQLIRWREEGKRNKEALGSSESLKTLESPGIITSQADKRFLERVNALIAQNVSNPNFSIDQMAELMHVGRTKLYGKIKELTGQSPNKLFMAERMRIAAELLKHSDFNVFEISCKVGILDASYFNKCFKQHYSMTPSKYRESE